MSQMNMTQNATLSAMFGSRHDAEDAVNRLRNTGIPEESIRLMPGYENDGQTTREPEHKGFFESLADFFMPDEDRYTYAEGLRRGGYLVTVTNIPAGLYEEALDILDDEGAIDLDTQQEAWRQEGWEGYRADSTAAGYSSGTTGYASSDTRDMDSGETIPVVEESLRIGKRDVSHGRVKVRSYVREEPINEDVHLRDERVTIERRPVDRAVGASDMAFKDRTIEAEEYGEEAVVDKQARVVEEIGLRKESDGHTETVSDTVKHTEVEIEDDRGNLRDTGSRR